MIHIANWLLTRKCNLNCSYCNIVKNYEGMPGEYKQMAYYHKYEMTTEDVLRNLDILKLHNPNMFHIFYGGEPMLRNDLYDIIHYCNSHNIYYTIISNNSDGVQDRIKNLFESTKVMGFTSSVDPVYDEDGDDDRLVKSRLALQRLKTIKENNPDTDVVAEITCTKENVHNLYRLVKELSQNQIHSSITFVDPAKNSSYDFSNVYGTELLVTENDVSDQFKLLMEDNDIKNFIHMRDTLLPRLIKTLPSNFDCEMEKGVHNMTIDADGRVRLCLRIKGIASQLLHVEDCFDFDGNISKTYQNMISLDKKNICEKCNWSCPIMSQVMESDNSNLTNLTHNR